MKIPETTALILIAVLIFAPLEGGVIQNLNYTYWQHGGANNSHFNTIDLQGWPTFLVSAFTLIVLIFQTHVYHRQRELMSRQAEIMSGQLGLTQDVAIRQLRAYVSVVGANVVLDARDFPRHVVVEFKNSGQTPAYNLRIWITVWLEKHPLRIDLPRQSDDFFGGTAIVAPGASTLLQSADLPPQNPEIYANFGTADCTLYAYGRASYIDAFGKPRHTDFRLIYGGQDGVESRGRMQPDNGGN